MTQLFIWTEIEQTLSGRSLKIYNFNHSTSKGQNINPFGSGGKPLEEFIPVSSCLHEMPLAMANPIFLVVEEPTTKPAVKHH